MSVHLTVYRKLKDMIKLALRKFGFNEHEMWYKGMVS